MNCTIVASEAGISSPEPPMPPPRRWASRRAAAEHLGCAAYRFDGLRTVRFDLNEIDTSLKPSIGQGVES